MKDLPLIIIFAMEGYLDGRKKKFISELIKRPRQRKESGLYVVDGPKMISELCEEDTEEIYVTKEFLSSANAPLCFGLLQKVSYTVITEQEMKQISDTATPQGIIALVKQRRINTLKDFMEFSGRYARKISEGKVAKKNDYACEPLLLILETIQDPGNLGTIIRAAEASGVTGIIASRDTVDIYSPKVVRSTMGAMLRMPYIAVEDLGKAVGALKAGIYTEGRKVDVYAAHLEGSSDYAKTDYTKPSAVMIGNESKGLSSELANMADSYIIIPMLGATESLNAAVAASVICFEAARQRRYAIRHI